MRWLLLVVAACMLAIPLASCDDNNSPPPVDLVTVAGHVRNVDNAQLASGVRVSLYGTTYQDEVATGTDGAYSLRVPRGSKVELYTDDFDSANDTWFPLVNVDPVPTFANQDIVDWPIHCCPNAPANGSVAAWNNFLQNSDDANGNRFVPTVCTQSGGIISIVFLEGINQLQVLPNLDSVSVASSSPAFPNGFVRLENFFSPTGPDPSLGPDILYPSSRTFTDGSGAFFSFGDPANTATTVTLQITDVTGRGPAFATPWVVPVRSGMITLILSGTMDDVPSGNFREFACWANMFPCTP
jgi:hypothetical protein